MVISIITAILLAANLVIGILILRKKRSKTSF